MPREIVILLLVIFIGGLLFPSLALAGEYQGYNNKTIKYEGLVPCGKSSYIVGVESPEVMLSCQFCHLFVMLDGIIDFITQKIVPPIVILMMIIAGIMFFFAGGNPTLLLQAKKLITSVAIGLIIIFSAYLIIGTVLTVARVQSWTTLDKWLSEGVFIVDCPIEVDGDGVAPENGNGNGDNGSPVDVGNSGKPVENDNDICIAVKNTATCEDNEKIDKGECIPGENTHIKPDESGITDDGKGWTCVFQGDEISPVPLPPAGLCYPPVGIIYLDCIDDPDYVPSEEEVWIPCDPYTENCWGEAKMTSFTAEVSKSCTTGKVYGGACFRINKTEMAGDIKGDEWCCKFEDTTSGTVPKYEGYIYIHCVPE